jgi:WS/DGAT/MGAT family acyltransferase
VPSIARFSAATARKVVHLGGQAFTSLRREGEGSLLGNLRALVSGDLTSLLPRMPPQTRFSGNVSAHRVFEAVALPLSEMRTIRQRVPRATINDQFLCVVGGALRAYLSDKNELPDASMVAMVPMTLRGGDKGGDRGNQVGFTVMPVHTEIEEPLERLRAVVDSAAKSKRVTDAIGRELARDLMESLPSIVTDPLVRNAQVPRIGLVVSNVRGPDVPLYMAGARLVHYVPISIAINGMGLNVTGFSYAGDLWICAVSCREMLPDPAFFADCLRAAFDRMKEAAARESAFESGEREASADVDAIDSDAVRVVRTPRKRKPGKAGVKPATPKGRVRKVAKVSRRRSRAGRVPANANA